MTKQESIEEIINKITNRKSKGKLFNRVPMTKQEESWEIEFDKALFHVFSIELTPDQRNKIIPELKSFINTLLERVREEVLNELFEKTQLDIKLAREEGRQEGMMDGGAIKAAIDSVAINKISRKEERTRIISLIDGMKSYRGRDNEFLEAIKNKINE